METEKQAAGEMHSADADNRVEGDGESNPIVELEYALAQAREEVLRAHAEMENQRRRMAREVESARKYGVERLLGDLVPALDGLEMGLAASAAEGVSVEKLREGSEMTLKLLHKAIENHGVSVIDPRGEAFDPERHQAMSMQPSQTAEPGTVLTVFQKGYLLNDRLVRPALVVVAKAPD